MVKMHSHVWFDRVVLFFIIFNCAVMALEEPGLDQNSKVSSLVILMVMVIGALRSGSDGNDDFGDGCMTTIFNHIYFIS